MRRSPGATLVLVVLAFAAAACSGGSGPTATAQVTAPPGGTAAATTAGAAATTAGVAATTPAPVTQPPAGGQTVAVTLTGGPTPGSYTGSANPNCSYGFLAPGTWGVSYGEADMTSGLTGVVLTAQPGSSEGQFAFQVGVIINNSATYTANNMSGNSSAAIQVTDNGSTAVIHITGPTIDGSASMDLTVNCPSVTRV